MCSQIRALRMRAPLAIAWVTLAGSMYPSVGRNAAASTPSVVINGNSSWARWALTISIGSPKLLAIVVSRFNSMTRSGEQARRRLPT